MTKRQQEIILFVLSFLWIPIWGIAFLSAKHSTFYSALFCFCLTLVYYAVLVSRWLLESKARLVSLAGPFLYVLFGIAVHGFLKGLILPISVAFFIIVAVLFIKKRFVLFLGFFAFFSFSVYYYKPFSKEPFLPNGALKVVSVEHNLFDLSFLDYMLDTVFLQNQGKPVLLKTWSETCSPCLLSFKHLQDVWAEFGDLSVFYLYQGRLDVNSPVLDVFLSRHSIDASKILFDPGNRFSERYQLTAQPVFLLFDQNGNLCYYKFGFAPSQRQILVNDLRFKLDSLSVHR